MKLTSKGLSLAIFLILTVGSSACAQSTAFEWMLSSFYDSDFPTILPEEMKGMENPLILDTREKAEFDVSHIKGAHYVGFNSFDITKVKEKNKNRPIVVYCSIGVRSEDIGKQLKDAGYTNVYNLYGGIFHWVNEGNKVYKGEKPTTKVHAYNRTWGIWLTSGEKVY